MRCKISRIVGGPGEAVEDEFEVAGAGCSGWGERSRAVVLESEKPELLAFWECAYLVGGWGVCAEAGKWGL
jgi:hypothetical protein